MYSAGFQATAREGVLVGGGLQQLVGYNWSEVTAAKNRPDYTFTTAGRILEPRLRRLLSLGDTQERFIRWGSAQRAVQSGSRHTVVP